MEKIRQALDLDENIRKIDDLDEKKLSPLHYAARYSNIEILKLLIKYGANPNQAGDDDMTPLHYSARYGRVVIPRERKRRKSTALSPRPQDQPDDDSTSILAITKAAEESLEAVSIFILLF